MASPDGRCINARIPPSDRGRGALGGGTGAFLNRPFSHDGSGSPGLASICKESRMRTGHGGRKSLDSVPPPHLRAGSAPDLKNAH